MAVHKKSAYLWLVDLDQELDGFREFISCWIFKNDDMTFVVDPGPVSTIPVLLTALKDLSIKKIDFILLTHIHIDHAGGTGLLFQDFPEAQIICHDKGIAHMVHPEKLWKGSLKVLGKIAETYGPIYPIDRRYISFQEAIVTGKTKIKTIETPGHAAHHLNFLVEGYLFAGEVAGVNIPFKNELYLRIATPPKFVYEIYKASLVKASQLDCDVICFGHYDMRTDIRSVFNAALGQLEHWLESVKSYYSKFKTPDPANIFNELQTTDPLLKMYSSLDKDIRLREKYFAENSIKGMLGYLADQK